jgi:hypothetical protein
LEFDTPQALLSDVNSQLSSLVEQTGGAEAEHLRLLANVASTKIKSNDQKLNDDNDGESPSNSAENDALIG